MVKEKVKTTRKAKTGQAKRQEVNSSPADDNKVISAQEKKG